MIAMDFDDARAAGALLLDTLREAGFEVTSWNLWPSTGKAQVVVDLSTLTNNEGK